MIKAVISGSKGRMGKRISELISKTDGITVAAGVDVGDPFEEAVKDADVALDFSTPDASTEHARICAEHRTPIVVGTTGLGDAHEKVLNDLSSIIPIVYAPNMSVGVNVMWKLIEMAARTLNRDYLIDIEETHHRHKTDKPSGTAKKMLEIVLENCDRHPCVEITYHEEAMPGRKKGDHSIRICSAREGEVVGDHEIKFRGMEDVLTIKHHAKSRNVFAKGAITAAMWVVGKPAGLYGMDDVLNLKM